MSRSKEQLQEAVLQSTESLQKSFQNIIEAAKIRPASQTAFSLEEDEELKSSAGIASSNYEDLFESGLRDKLHSEIFAHELVHSAEALMSIIFELELNKNIRNVESALERANKMGKMLIDKEKDNQDILRKISYEVDDAIVEMEEVLYSSNYTLRN